MWLAALLLLVFTPQGWTASSQPITRTNAGQVRGVRMGPVDAFLGIPYAQPPVGPLRWRAPEPARPWKGVRDATRFGTNCYQAPPTRFGPYTPEFLISLPVSEDCLYLNVWTPARHASNLPVYFFIHGGGFGSGSGSIPIYNGAHLAARNAVVVTVNYRLGVLGFLALPALSQEASDHVSGNYGLLDIIAALRWVHENIGQFGGDASLVTIAGQSAGAGAVNDLIVSPIAKGLFSRAIAESGSGLGAPMPTLHDAETQGEQLVQSAGAHSLSALRAMPAAQLLKLTFVAPPSSGVRQPGSPPPIRYGPVDDGVVIAGDPKDPTSPLQSNVPLLTGYNHEDIGIGGLPPTTPQQFEAAIRMSYGPLADQFLALYPHATDAEATASQAQITRDRLMASLVLWAQARARASGEPVYGYLYDHPYPGPEAVRYGAFHTSEVPYVFGVLDQGGRPFTAHDHQVSTQLQGYWLNFMKDGNPNGPTDPAWGVLQPGTDSVMGLGDHPGPRPAVSTPQRFAAFQEFVEQHGTLASIP
jgi:para-nitrobenzyl esterase